MEFTEVLRVFQIVVIITKLVCNLAQSSDANFKTPPRLRNKIWKIIWPDF